MTDGLTRMQHNGAGRFPASPPYTLTPDAMVLRAVRAAVRDHALRDPYAVSLDADSVGSLPLWTDGPDAITRDDVLRDRIYEIRYRRGADASRHHPSNQTRATVHAIMADVGPCPDALGVIDGWHDPTPKGAPSAFIIGNAEDLDTKYGRAGEIVVRVRYAETWIADYAVSPDPDGPAVCWID